MVRNPALEQIIHVSRVKGESEGNSESALDVGNDFPTAVEMRAFMAMAECEVLGAEGGRGVGRGAWGLPEGMERVGEAADEGLQFAQGAEVRPCRWDDFDGDLGMAGGIEEEGGEGKGLVRRGTGDVEPERVPVLGLGIGKIAKHKAIGQGAHPG
jgi:hypothetical protein